MAKLKKIGGKAQGDGWPSSERECQALADVWPGSGGGVAKLREMGGHTHEDGWPSSDRECQALTDV